MQQFFHITTRWHSESLTLPWAFLHTAGERASVTLYPLVHMPSLWLSSVDCLPKEGDTGRVGLVSSHLASREGYTEELCGCRGGKIHM